MLLGCGAALLVGPLPNRDMCALGAFPNLNSGGKWSGGKWANGSTGKGANGGGACGANRPPVWW